MNTPNDPLTFIARRWRDRTPGVLVSIIQAEGIATQLGSCLTLTSQSIRVLGETEPPLIEAMIPDAQAVLQDQQSVVKQYELATRPIKVLPEFIQPPRKARSSCHST